MNDSYVFSGTFFLLLVIFSAAGYVLGAYVLFRIGSKFGIGTFGEYCIPVYNYILLCRSIEISPWLLLWLLVPLANLGFLVYLWGSLAKKLGHDFWLYGLGILLFGIPAFILAFDSSKPAVAEKTVTFSEPSIYCVSGEFAGNRLPVGSGGVIIGRSPAKSNLVLSSLEISAMHARVWSDRDGRVWLQDMSSSNGTYYSKPGNEGAPDWIEVTAPVALDSGTHIRLGDDAVEFVVS